MDILKTNKKEILALIFILIISCFFRCWHLNHIPPGLYPDEAINANQAAAEPGKIFYPENNGREGLFINLISLSFKIFGISIWSLRFVPALIGIFTVIGLYLLAKELFNSTVGLAASFFLTISFWHINFSRIAFRGILVPFCLTYSFYFLFRGFRKEKIVDLIAAGIFFGLGFHTYISFRFAVLLLPVFLGGQFLIYRRDNSIKRFSILCLWFLSIVFLIGLPIGLYFARNPGDFLGRGSGVSIFSQENPGHAFLESLIKHLAIFNIRGDSNWRHNIAKAPALFGPTGFLFLVGFIYSIKEITEAIKKRDYLLITAHGSLMSWWLIMLLPGILTYEGVPHHLRVIGIIPPLFIFPGLILDLARKQIAKIRQKLNISDRHAFYLTCLGLSLLIPSFVLAGYFRYFNLWAVKKEVEDAFSQDYVTMGRLLNSLSDEITKYVIVNQDGVLVNNIPMPAQTLMFIERTKFKEPRAIYLNPENTKQISGEGKTIIVLMRKDKNVLRSLTNTFPAGQIGNQAGVWFFEIE